MKNRTIPWFSAIGVFAVASLIGLSMPTLANAQTKVRVGLTVTTDIASAALFNAIKKGSFKKEGIDIEVKPFIQSNQKYDTFKGGSIDMDINMSAVTSAQLQSAGVPFVVVKAMTPADIWAVVARSDSTLSTPGDFKGRRFGVVSLSGTNYGVTHMAFKLAGVDLMRDVKVSTLPPATLVAALERGEVDGATLYEPYLSDALKSGRVKELFRPGVYYEKAYKEPFIALVMAVRKDFYDSNRVAVAKVLAILDKEAKELKTNLPEASQAFVEGLPELKLKSAEALQLLKPYAGNYILEPNDPSFLKVAQNFYDRLLEIKQIPRMVRVTDFWVKP